MDSKTINITTTRISWKFQEIVIGFTAGSLSAHKMQQVIWNMYDLMTWT